MDPGYLSRSLRYPSHQREVSVFSSLCSGIGRLYAKKRYCDINVEVDGKQFPCHRLVLSAVSGYFNSVLTEEEPNNRVHVIQNEDVSSDAFKKILSILYSGQYNITDPMIAWEVLLASKFLQISFLIPKCMNVLEGTVPSQNCLDSWQFAEKHDLKILERNARKTACQEFESIFSSSVFRELSKEYLLVILTSLDLCVTVEDNLLKAILSWTNEHPQERACHLPELLPFVCFSNISENYIHVICQMPLFAQAGLREYIQENMILRMETTTKLNSCLKAKILGRQEKLYYRKRPPVKRFVVVVGGNNRPDEHTTHVKKFAKIAYDTNNTTTSYRVFYFSPSDITTPLQPFPENIGINFATCIWRNELYVSGGSVNPKLFCVYNPGIDDWEMLPDLPAERQSHTMVSYNWNIYILGGIIPHADGLQTPSDDVFAYNVTTKSWSKFASLITALQSATASVLGHRIYVFGGRNLAGNATSVVQCVDTQSGNVYQAGQLPAPTWGARSLSNGRSVFIVCKEGEVLRMKEAFHTDICTQHKEPCEYADDVGVCLGLNGSPAGFASNETARKSVALATGVNDETPENSVFFENLATFPKRSDFGAFIHGEELVIYGGSDENGCLLQDVVGIYLNSGGTIPTYNTERPPISHFEMQLINAPVNSGYHTESVDFKFTFKPDSILSEEGICSHDVKLNRFYWYLKISRNTKSGLPALAVYLFKRESKQGMWQVTANSFSFWITPTLPSCKVVSEEFKYTFTDSNICGMGTSSLISFKELTNPKNGYIRDGEVTINVKLSIEVPPKPEETNEQS